MKAKTEHFECSSSDKTPKKNPLDGNCQCDRCIRLRENYIKNNPHFHADEKHPQKD